MPVPRSPEARRYYRVALQRLGDSKAFAEERPAASIYLAGYAVECILKSLVLCHVPVARHQEFIRSNFHGPWAHNLQWLRSQLRTLGSAAFPPAVIKDLAFVSTWSVELRYTPGMGSPREAARFIDAVERIVEFVKGRLI